MKYTTHSLLLILFTVIAFQFTASPCHAQKAIPHLTASYCGYRGNAEYPLNRLSPCELMVYPTTDPEQRLQVKEYYIVTERNGEAETFIVSGNNTPETMHLIFDKLQSGDKVYISHIELIESEKFKIMEGPTFQIL